jgi:hypothetical protein
MPVTVTLPTTPNPTAIVVVAAAVPVSVVEASLLGTGMGESEAAAAAREMAIVDVRGADASEVEGDAADTASWFGGRTKPRRVEQVCGSSPC